MFGQHDAVLAAVNLHLSRQLKRGDLSLQLKLKLHELMHHTQTEKVLISVWTGRDITATRWIFPHLK